MNEKEFQKNEEIEIDVGRLFRAVVNRAWLVAIIAVLCAGITFAGTFFFITPKYQSSAMFYVNNRNLSLGDPSVSISSGDLATSRNLVDSYIVILNTRETLVDAIDYAGASLSYEQLRDMLSAAAVSETEIFKVTVTSEDPLEAERLANAIADILPKRIGAIMDGTSAKVVETAIVPSAPSAPSYTKNTLIGFLVGILLAAGFIALRELFDNTIRSEADIVGNCKYHILASVPDMTVPSKGSSHKKARSVTAEQQTACSIMGPNLSFAAAEAYKLLRTKLQFSFADENDCHVIGVSGAIRGEGRSLTAVNLAYAMAQLDKNVLLVDCDLRWSNLAEKLSVPKQPGLSNYLTGQCSLDELIQPCELKKGEYAFHVITAGENPSNPVELLSSATMQMALSKLRGLYDYVILDLPPVGEVADALAIAKETDGILLVVRQNCCDRLALADAVKQFEFMHSKMLGIVLNCASAYAGNCGK